MFLKTLCNLLWQNYRSEGFPQTGLFHPWAQWDLGLDTWENSSRRAVAVAAVVVVAPECDTTYYWLRVSA